MQKLNNVSVFDIPFKHKGISFLGSRKMFYAERSVGNGNSNLELRPSDPLKKWGLLTCIIAICLMVLIRYLSKRRLFKGLQKMYQDTKIKNENLVTENRALYAERSELQFQKDWLLSEIHHRVRNNLHTIVSLLESQAMFLKNDALFAMVKSQHRIYAMSMIHQKIYCDEQLKVVDFESFVYEFTEYLNDSYDTVQKIEFQIDLLQMRVSVAQATPLALLMNEVITNAILHAFCGRSAGSIAIKMQVKGDMQTLVIADNGQGIAKGMDWAASLGMVLIKGLSEDINGEVQITSDRGTVVTLTFPVERTFGTNECLWAS